MIHTLHIKRQKVFDSSVMIKSMIEIPLIDRPISATIYQMHTLLEKKRNTLWRCCYCGKKLKKREIEVDHLIPVYKAKRQRHWQKKLPNGVNDKTNLVAACRHCNRMKSSKTGLWYVRGLLGQHQLYWKIIYPLTLVITTILLGVIIYYL